MGYGGTITNPVPRQFNYPSWRTSICDNWNLHYLTRGYTRDNLSYRASQEGKTTGSKRHSISKFSRTDFCFASKSLQRTHKIRKREIIALLQIQENKDVSEIYVAGGVEDLGVLPEEESVCHVVPEEQIGDINAQEKQVFLKLLDEFQDIFAKDEFDLGKAQGTIHKIDTNHNGPLFQHSYQRSPTSNKIIQEEVDRLLKGNLIKPPNSPLEAPFCWSRKRMGQIE